MKNYNTIEKPKQLSFVKQGEYDKAQAHSRDCL